MQLGMIVLGLVQGISEILPVSSSVNLHFFSKICSIQEFSFLTKIALHAGSLVALLIFFRSDIHDILVALFSKEKRLAETYFFQLVFAMVPIVIIGYWAKDYVKEFNSAVIMGVSSIVFGCFLVVFDKISSSIRAKGRPSILDAIVIGMFQAISIFPGVSRLGICITGARMLSIPRAQALRFSMLLAIPSILGSVTLELGELRQTARLAVSNDIMIGVLVTAVVGLLFIRTCLRHMEKSGFFMIAVYRILIGSLACLI
jgi:undecaprenyl-diphosphatase